MSFWKFVISVLYLSSPGRITWTSPPSTSRCCSAPGTSYPGEAHDSWPPLTSHLSPLISHPLLQLQAAPAGPVGEPPPREERSVGTPHLVLDAESYPKLIFTSEDIFILISALPFKDYKVSTCTLHPAHCPQHLAPHSLHLAPCRLGRWWGWRSRGAWAATPWRRCWPWPSGRRRRRTGSWRRGR